MGTVVRAPHIITCSGFSELSHTAAWEIWGRNWTAYRNHECIGYNRRCLAATVGFIYQKAASVPVLSDMGACLCVKLATSFHQMLPQRRGNECKIKAQAAKRMDQTDPTSLCCLWKNLVLTSVSTEPANRFQEQMFSRWVHGNRWVLSALILWRTT